MFDWYVKKLDELINLTRYCSQPLLEAHFVLTRHAVIDTLGDTSPCEVKTNDELKKLISLCAQQAKRDNCDAAAAHLQAAIDTLEGAPEKESSVVRMDFAQIRETLGPKNVSQKNVS